MYSIMDPVAPLPFSILKWKWKLLPVDRHISVARPLICLQLIRIVYVGFLHEAPNCNGYVMQKLPFLFPAFVWAALFALLRPKNVLTQRKMDYFYKLIRVVLAQLFHSSWCISFCLLRFLVIYVLRLTVEGCRKSFYIDSYQNGLKSFFLVKNAGSEIKNILS